MFGPTTKRRPKQRHRHSNYMYDPLLPGPDDGGFSPTSASFDTYFSSKRQHGVGSSPVLSKFSSDNSRTYKYLLSTILVVAVMLLSYQSSFHYYDLTLISSSVTHEETEDNGTITTLNNSSNNYNEHQDGLLNHNVIYNSLLAEAPWAESHGANHEFYLGAGLLYYSFAYAFQSQTIVVLGSGGGFVPRVLRQAQRDLLKAGIVGQQQYQVILIDAHLPEAGFGSTFYAENMETVMRQQFHDIRFVFLKTDDAFLQLQQEGVTIDYLHVDADHSAEQSWADFDNFSQLLNPRAVVSFHDTCRSAKRNCNTGVPQALDKLRGMLPRYNLQLIDAHYLYRGIAFAIPMDAPAALEPPVDHKWKFCQHNVAVLNKASPGFTLNKEIGKLATLGDFYQCDSRFDMTTAREDPQCPFGQRRSHLGGPCDACIPGMTGTECTEYEYTKLRQQASPATVMVPETIPLITAWLKESQGQHIFELGVSGPPFEIVSKPLVVESHNSPLQSVLATDPWMESPVWTPEGVYPALRLLPCRPEDVVNGKYTDQMTTVLERVDTLVCQHCDKRLPTWTVLALLLKRSLPSVTTLILEGSDVKDTLLEGIAETMEMGAKTRVKGVVVSMKEWEIVSDVSLMGNHYRRKPNSGDIDPMEPRRIMLLKKKTGEIATTTTKPRNTKTFPLSDFPVAGVNLGLYNSTLMTTEKATPPPQEAPFELYDDFDINHLIVGNETWEDLVRYRRDLQRPTLSFYVDKVARRRWLQSQTIATPEAFLLQYASEMTATGSLESEKTFLHKFFDTHSILNDFAAKPTHLSCSAGVWLTKTDPTSNTTLISHGTRTFEGTGLENRTSVVKEIVDSLAQDLHAGIRCGNQRESWALENVKPGVMIEQRFEAVGDDEANAGAMEFKVITIWGRVWLAQWRPGVSKVRAFLHRNGTALDWEDDATAAPEPLPEWVDWSLVVNLAERLGAHKDMFRTDIFVGIPAGSKALAKNASLKERLAAVQYVVSETEIHPTPLKGTEAVFQEGGRLWLAGYKIGNYKVVPDAEVPEEFVAKGVFSGTRSQNRIK